MYIIGVVRFGVEKGPLIIQGFADKEFYNGGYS